MHYLKVSFLVCMQFVWEERAVALRVDDPLDVLHLLVFFWPWVGLQCVNVVFPCLQCYCLF